MHVGLAAVFQNPQRGRTDREVYRGELRLADLAEPLGGLAYGQRQVVLELGSNRRSRPGGRSLARCPQRAPDRGEAKASVGAQQQELSRRGERKGLPQILIGDPAAAEPDLATRQELAVLGERDGRLNAVRFAPGGDTLASAGDNGTVALYFAARDDQIARQRGDK